jgi:RNA polymerase sigma-70 factor (ECF subfamily)
MLLRVERPAELDDTERRQRFRAMFEAEFAYVWRSLRRLGVAMRDVDDVSQEVFIHVYRRLDDYDPRRPARPWLFAFAFRCASDWRRLARHRVEVMADADQREASVVPADDALVRAEDRDLALRALEAIELERRAVLILYEFDECPMRDIAEALGVPLFTAYSRLRVAREEFTTAVRRLRVIRGDP